MTTNWTDFYSRNSLAVDLAANAPAWTGRPKPPSPARVQADRAQARYERRGNMCKGCGLAKPVSRICCD